ncbi:uracil phosphoribosyltransferase-domain-containing protein [Xylariaceae sp. AK1471]|nr:uracil phosphoribosyltransferase-domain-containing protein [Xylariaceae sp. AK1471]
MSNLARNGHHMPGTSAADNALVTVGVFGIPGSGKTYLLDQLAQELGRENFVFYEGSDVVTSLIPSGVDRFQKLDKEDKVNQHQPAVDAATDDSPDNGPVAVIAGCFMPWPWEGENIPRGHTPNTLGTYTHIVYLDTPAELIAQRRREDTRKARPYMSVNSLRKWQYAEKTQLGLFCSHHNISFYTMSSPTTLVAKVSTLLQDFRHHTEAYSLSRAEGKLDEIFGGNQTLETVLVLDADSILVVEDTSNLLWAAAIKSKLSLSPAESLLSSPLDDSYTVISQAVLLYQRTADEQDFKSLCTLVASVVRLDPEIVSLLKLVVEQDHVGALVVTRGQCHVWEKILEREGLSRKVNVIGGGRVADGFDMTAAVKAAVITRLRNIHHLHIWAFGSTPLDLPMLSVADEAVVVASQKKDRSTAMAKPLLDAIEHGGLRASQVLLPSHVFPVLSVDKLPVLQINSIRFIRSVLRRRNQRAGARVLHATGRAAAKLLIVPTHHVSVGIPGLREAYRHIGWFLTTEFLTKLVGLEEYTIPHIQGHQTCRFRLRSERHTLIVGLMCGGGPMASGVSDALPDAMFVQAKGPDDVMEHHLDGQCTVILVDSVVDSGNTVMQFVQHIRTLYPAIRIVVVAGVVQAQCISEGSLAHILACDDNFSLVALRLEDN